MIRTSEAEWEGNLKTGKGTVSVGSGLCEGNYSFGSRFEQARGTNPEELLGAAHAGCFSMALSMILEQAGYTVENIHTIARVNIEKTGQGWRITTIELDTEGLVPGIDERTFRGKAEEAKKDCPVSVALAGVEIILQARLAKLAA
jgi:osmotically inducible protein OsmC